MKSPRSIPTIARTSLVVLLLAGQTDRAWAAGDVFDQFFRYTEKENRVFRQELPGETVDPFTGTLRVVQTDLVLPGKAGLDLRVQRAYSSKIWGRSDLLDSEPLLAEKEKSVLGWGWTFHMGRLKNPQATGASTTCSGDFPVYEAPDGTARTFYPVAGSKTIFISKDYWKLSTGCGAGACIWSTDGTRYELSNATADRFYYGGTVPVWPLAKVVDLHGNVISVTYKQDSTGRVDVITDTYGRKVSFGYDSSTDDGWRLTSMTANGNSYIYSYTTYAMLPGKRRFLTAVSPPAGPPYQYGYAIGVGVSQNEGALASITYPGGGTASYVYNTTSFFTGWGTVPFAVVRTRTLAGRGVTKGTWTYTYSAPESGGGMNLTTVDRPDSTQDKYTIYGFGYAAAKNQSGYTWMVGLTQQISRASGAEVETLSWDARKAQPVSSAYYGAPTYAACGAYQVWDTSVYAPVMSQRVLTRDDATYTTTYSEFDDYGQAKTVVESGQQSRTTTWTYFYLPSANIVRGRPSSQHVCVNSECFDNSWTYDGPGNALDSETLSNVKTKFGYFSDGNLNTVTNARGEKLTLDGYSSGWGTPTSFDFNGAFTINRTAYWEGWLWTQKDGRGYKTTYEYDAIGRPKNVTPPVGYATGYSYAPDGSWSLESRGSYSKYTYLDGLGRVTSTSDSEGTKTSQSWDNMGRAEFKSYPYDSSTTQSGDQLNFDVLGRVKKLTKAYHPGSGTCDQRGACEVDYVYSKNCVTTTVHRGTDNVATTRCNASFGNPDEGRLATLTDAAANAWSYGYNAFGKLTSVTAPLSKGNKSYHYDTKQALDSETSNESGTTTYPNNNELGQPVTRKDARGITWTYGYNDPLSRLRTIDYGNGSADNVTKDYDQANNAHSIASTSGGSFIYDYDEINRPALQTWTFANKTYTTKYLYDSAGCLYSMTYPTGTTLTMTCDSKNRIKTVTLGDSTIVKDALYHPSGQIKSMTYGNGKITTLTYDDRARAKTMTATNVIGLKYDEYDGADNLRTFSNTMVAGSGLSMKYDALDRLSSVTNTTWGSAAYDYDPLGNRTFKSPGGSVSLNYTYGTTNRLDTVTGPVDQLPKPMTLTWSDAGRLASTSDGASYLYDGLGRRVQKTASGQSTVYHYDVAGHVIAETLPDGTKVRDYIYLGNKLIAVDGCLSGAPPSCTSERQWYHTDALGSVVARTDSAGALKAQFDYQPWGEQRTVPSVQGDRQYNGRVYDPGTGFHDYGARLYWPEIGRFISADSYYGDQANPASLNRYAYVHNNPYKYVDPTGEVAVALSQQERARINAAMQGASEGIQTLRDGNASLLAKVVGALKVLNGVMVGSGADMLPAPSAMAVAGEKAVAQVVPRVANGANHIFGPKSLVKHGLESVLKFFKGDKVEAFKALESGAQELANKGAIKGVFETTVKVGGEAVTVRGAVVDGTAQLSTAFIPPPSP